MDCPKCEGGIVMGELAVTVRAPLNRKGGGLKLAGIGVKQSDIKEAWDALSSEYRTIRCNSCEAEFSYVPGTGIVEKGDDSLQAVTLEGEDGEEALEEEEILEEEEEPAEEEAPVRRRISAVAVAAGMDAKLPHPPKPKVRFTLPRR